MNPIILIHETFSGDGILDITDPVYCGDSVLEASKSYAAWESSAKAFRRNGFLQVTIIYPDRGFALVDESDSWADAYEAELKRQRGERKVQ
jgi:hypothetical protein